MLGTVLAKGGGTSSQVANTYPITESELKIGDLGFLNLGNKGYNHVGIYAGKVNGKNVFIHCGGRHFKDSTHRAGRVLISYNDGTSYKGNKSTNFKYFRRVYVNFKDDNVVGSVNQ
jgi:cell wall-associated NlpC family hydrolase